MTENTKSDDSTPSSDVATETVEEIIETTEQTIGEWTDSITGTFSEILGLDK